MSIGDVNKHVDLYNMVEFVNKYKYYKTWDQRFPNIELLNASS